MLGLLTEMDWVPGVRSDWLTLFFKAFTELGGTWFAVLFLVSCYLFWRKDAACRLIVLSVVSKILNAHLKAAYTLPRPDIIYRLTEVTESSFPSGHAQHAATMWLWLASEIGNSVAWVLGIFITIGVGFSRVYLGVHYLRDVVAGLLIGTMMVVFLRSSIQGEDSTRRRGLFQLQVVLALLIQGFWWWAIPNERYVFLPVVIFLGFWGCLLIRRRFGQPLSRVWRILPAVVIVAFGALPIFTGGSRWMGPVGLGTHPISVYFQFGLLGAWGALMAKNIPK